MIHGVWGAGTKSTDERAENFLRVQHCCPDLVDEFAEVMADLGHLPLMTSPDDPAHYDRMTYAPDLVVQGSPSVEDLKEVLRSVAGKLVVVIEGRLGAGKTKLAVEAVEQLGLWSIPGADLSGISGSGNGGEVWRHHTISIEG